ncbi:MAG TPA: helix-turn-helix transcriptional regulator [Streptosporangiaceae bacterium]
MNTVGAGQGPVVESALLRAELVQLRRERGLTQEQVGHSLDWHPSKLIRIEGGKSGISKTDLRALLGEYGVTSESRREKLETLASGARAQAWWSQYRDVEDETSLRYIGYEAGASVIRHLQTTIVPGPLQTEEYAEVISSYYLDDRAKGERKAALRARRLKEMDDRDNPPRRFYVLDEAIIWRHIGVRRDPGIMPQQLHYIADLVERNDLITVRVVPFSSGAHAGLDGPFVLLEFDGALNDQLYREGSSTVTQAQGSLTGDEEVVTDYRAAFEAILEEALDARGSLKLIREAAEKLVETRA